MIIGSGMLGRGFSPNFSKREDVCIYAAGVSNSSNTDKAEFEREKARLTEALITARGCSVFVYFGTCSILDTDAQKTEYVQHKLVMERLVETHSNYLILRLPQVAGISSNHHTLLNFIFQKIKRNEIFSLHQKAYRNIIDIDDVVAIGSLIIDNMSFRKRKVNLANPENYAMTYILSEMESVIGKSAKCSLVDIGSNYHIDVTPIEHLILKSEISFDGYYLNRTLTKYYGKN